MAVISKRLATPSLLSAAAVSKYLVPPNNITKDIELHFTNTDTTNTIGVTVYLVESGGAAGDSNTFLKEAGASAFLLGPGESRAWGTEQVLLAGDTLHAKASTASKIAMFISGKEISQG
jgi:hypothetical protein